MRNFITVVFLVAALFAAGFHQPSGAQARPLRIAVSFPDISRIAFKVRAQMIQEEAVKVGNVTVDVFDANNQQDDQNKDLELIAVQKYDGLIMSPVNLEQSMPAIQAVIDEGIPVVTVARNATGVQTLAHVGADDRQGGELQAKIIMSLFPKGAQVINIQGTPGTKPAADRNKGLHSVLDKNAGYKIVFEQTGNFLREDAASVTEKALNAVTPLPDVITVAGEDMVYGVLDVLEKHGLTGKITVIGWEASAQILKLLQDGKIAATIEPYAGKQAQTALRTLVDFIREGKQPEQHDVNVPPILITTDNLQDAERFAQLQALATPGAAGTAAATMEATSSK